ncbi:MAG: IS4 family transposase [Candidatus Ventricola sp.]
MPPTKHTMSVLAQITSWIPDRIIENLARKHRIQARSFSATSHVMSMVYGHLAHALSLNDICDSLSSHAGTLEQIRGCTPPSRNGLSHANRTRSADMAEELFWSVYESLSRQHPEFLTSSRNCPGLPYRFRKRTIRAVDSTTIQLTAFSMGWAKHRRQKAAAKMHTALNMRSFLPNFVIVKSARDSDPKSAWGLCADMRAGEVVVLDKAYVDFSHLKALADRGVSWVTRPKENMLYEAVGQQTAAGADAPGVSGAQAEAGATGRDMGQQTAAGADAPGVSGAQAEAGATGTAGVVPEVPEAGAKAGATGRDMGQHTPRKYTRRNCRVLSDERIRLTGVGTREHYPEELRLVRAEVEIKGRMVAMSFITNNMEWAAFTICQLYQCRWGVEVFFKEIKQTLQLADFLGYNENAVRWQIWTALLTCLLLRFVAWYNRWRHPFSRFFTLVRAVLWNFFLLNSVIEYCDTVRERRKRVIRGSPETAYQLTLW